MFRVFSYIVVISELGALISQAHPEGRLGFNRTDTPAY